MPAYAVFTRIVTKEPEALAAYHPMAQASGAGHDLTALVAYGPQEVVEGPPHEGMVILRFPSMAEARAWYDSPAYQAAREQRFKGADYQVTLVEGV